MNHAEEFQRAAENVSDLAAADRVLTPAPEPRTLQIVNPKTGKVLWKSNPGPQTDVLFRRETEILFGGSRGGGKSQAGIVWLLLGNWALPVNDPLHFSYINDSRYRALVLRRNAEDLKEWIDEAKLIYEPLGAKFTGKPGVFEFPSGAKIYTNHLDSEDAFEKYKGWSLWKILIEELTLIPKSNAYLKLLGSLRAFNADGKVNPQLFATTNPDGAGNAWTCNRFVEVPSTKGGNVPWGVPMFDPITKLSRIFVPAKVIDNPYAKSNPSYMGMLLSQDKQTQDAWIHGLWHSMSGTFFTEWRNQLNIGPRVGEPIWANHVTRPVPLKPWFFRWGGGDWGYKHYSALYKFCKNQTDGRVHVYDELITKGVGSFDLGTKIAQWWLPDLELLPDRHITLFFSPETFSEQDSTNTRAQQVQAGIQAIMGLGSCFILKPNKDEEMLAQENPEAARRVFEQRRASETGKMCITLKKANHDRADGAAFIRDLLRFTSAEISVEPDLDRAKYIYEHQGLAAYTDHMKRYQGHKPEVLPKIQVWQRVEGNTQGCPQLIRCIPMLQHDAKKPEDVMKIDADNGQQGDDPYDAFRYGAMAYKDIEKTIPKDYYVNERMDEFGEGITDINSLHMIRLTQQARYDKEHGSLGGSFTFPRAGAPNRKWRN